MSTVKFTYTKPQAELLVIPSGLAEVTNPLYVIKSGDMVHRDPFDEDDCWELASGLIGSTAESAKKRNYRVFIHDDSEVKQLREENKRLQEVIDKLIAKGLSLGD